MERPALVLVDLQKDFLFSKPGHVGSWEKGICLPSVRAVLELARTRSWRIVHVLTSHRNADTLPTPLKRAGLSPYCVVGTGGAAPVSRLVLDGDSIIEKQGYSGFDGTELAVVLQEHRQLVIAGVAADCCVLKTALDAASPHGKEVFLPYQAIGASNLDSYLAGFRVLAKSAGTVVNLADLVAGESLEKRLEVPLSSVEERLRPWFRPRAELISSLRSELNFEDVDRSLELLERRLGEISDP